MTLFDQDSMRPTRRSAVRLVSFNEAFPHAAKAFHVPAREVAVPEAVVLATDRPWASLRGQTYIVPEDYVAELHDVLYCPVNSVLLADPMTVVEESTNGSATFSKALRPIPRHSGQEPVITGTCSLLRSSFSGFFHQVAHNFPRVIALNRPPYSDLDEIKLLTPRAPSQVEQFFLPRLGLANLNVTPVKRDTLYRIEHLLFTPYKSRQFAGYLPEYYVKAYREAVCPKRPSRGDKRILISRLRSRRHIRNENELMRCLGGRGFSAYILEDLPLQAQIELFYDAEVVIGTHGAGLANLIFAPSTKVVELFPKRYVVPTYLFMACSLGQPYRFLCNNDSPFQDLAYLSWRVRKSLRLRGLMSEGPSPHPPMREFDLSFKVDVAGVEAILDAIGVH